MLTLLHYGNQFPSTYVFLIIRFNGLIYLTVHVGGSNLHKLHGNWGQGIKYDDASENDTFDLYFTSYV